MSHVSFVCMSRCKLSCIMFATWLGLFTRDVICIGFDLYAACARLKSPVSAIVRVLYVLYRCKVAPGTGTYRRSHVIHSPTATLDVLTWYA